MRLVISDVRLAFPKIWRPEAFPGSPDKTEYYSASGILAPNHPQIAAINKAIEDVAQAKFGQKWQAVLAAAKAQGKVCLRDGNSKPDTEGYAGNLFISARSKVRPKIFGQLGIAAGELKESDGKPYGGSYVRMVVSIFAYSNVAKGIAAELGDIQFIRDGDAFSGGGQARAGEDDFGSVAVDDPLAG
jgi:hypothetical protein